VSSPQALLGVQHLTAGYSGTTVLSGVSFTVEAGTVALFIGANGAGKSTLGRAVVGLAETYAGQVRLAGQAVQTWAPHRRIAGGIGFVPQDPVTFPSFRVERCLSLAARHVPKQARRAKLEQVYELFPEVAANRHKRSELLSGGQQRMLGFAMSMCGNPKLIVVDEPSAGVAPALTTRLLGMLRDLARSQQMGILLIEQNVSAALEVADVVHVLRRGELAGVFRPDELRDRDNVWDLL
jgi:branched-chain amino acid transport system ATP-binding protein